jgi:hypothetical protein
MKLIVIPNFGERISPRIDYAESLQLITVEDGNIIIDAREIDFNEWCAVKKE